MSPPCVTHRGLFYSFSFPKPFISVRNPVNKQKIPALLTKSREKAIY